MKPNELRVGMCVCTTYQGKESIPMKVVGLYTSLADIITGKNNEDCDVYLDFEGNEGDVWECKASELSKYEDEKIKETKEIHFFTNLANEMQVAYVKTRLKVCLDYVDTLRNINDENIRIVRTTQLCFLKNAMDYYRRGWKVYIHNGDGIIEVKTGKMKNTDKEIRIQHNIERLFIGGTFGEVK